MEQVSESCLDAGALCFVGGSGYTPPLGKYYEVRVLGVYVWVQMCGYTVVGWICGCNHP